MRNVELLDLKVLVYSNRYYCMERTSCQRRSVRALKRGSVLKIAPNIDIRFILLEEAVGIELVSEDLFKR